jgi:hypothetical protein
MIMDTRITSQPYASPAEIELGDAISSAASAVSWAAILSGAVVAAASSIMLLSLGSGLGFASISPWSNGNPSVTTVTVMTGVWLIVVQWLASALGGYMTGRLRTRWVNVHTHEVFFRDTAHGFLAWAVATVLVAAIVAAGAASAVSGGVRAASTAVSGAAQGATASAGVSRPGDPSAYTVDTLFRTSQGTDQAQSTTSSSDARGEAARILAMGVTNGNVPATDRTYLASLVAAHTGIPQADAEQRVDGAIAQTKATAEKARQAADEGRKAASAFSIFTALAMVIGAFIASVAAAFGGRLRDEHA